MKKVIFCLSIGIAFATQADNDVSNMHRYLWANCNQFAGKKDVAYECYKEIFKSNPPLAVYKGYAHLLFESGQYKALVQLMNTVEPLIQNDPELGLLFAFALENTGNSAAADKLFIALNEKSKQSQETTFYAANAYVRRKEPENALKVIDALLNKAPRKSTFFVFYFLKSQINAKLGNYPQALENIQYCLDLQPAFDKGWLMLALLQENAGRLTEAIKGYNTFLEISGANQEVEQHVLQLAFQQTLQHNQAVPLPGDAMRQALGFLEKREYQAALNAVQKFLQTQPKHHEARILYIEILVALKKYQDAFSLLKTWIAQDTLNTEWFKILSLLPKSGAPYADVIRTLNALGTTMKDSLPRALYLADAYMRSKNYPGALSALQQAFTLTQDSDLKTKILFQMGLLHYELGDFFRMQSVLEQGYQLGTEYPPLLNLLAYYYTTKEKDLPKAQKLISLALKKDKYNPHFLDTQALVLYNQQRYPKALKVLQKLSKAEPKDSTIQKHLGKTYYKMGKYKEALQTFKTAQALATNEREKKNNAKFLKKLQAYEQQ